ncbi:ATP-dependent RNA helicase HrpA [Moritella sp. JT01]|uniref:ATP-dependent RNA helicase HrpA n=1 Tax=Moritella sp. JT01 TaxID=756698 RepID=UPI00079B95FA|nr:ATP-dependent RNA helicase HrpA [Moritella sp. JT01]KXO09082.1 ATP-dependent RNA helicase HrpA [Moritella sp. JT01]
MQSILKSLTAELSNCMHSDRFHFKRRLQTAQKLPSEKQEKAIDKLQQDIAASSSLRQSRIDNLPVVSYPEDLPISQKRDDIANAILNNQVVIIAGETGSGKTTQIPKICLDLGLGIDGMIGHTQPRRLAARTVANRIAEELDSELGEHVGYKIRFNDNVSKKSYIKLMTDGILLAEIQQDRFLSKYDVIIIDEAHERSLNIDFILGYLKQLLNRRPDLKVIITSATIDPERFSKHFGNAPMIEVSGRTYPVEVRYNALAEQEDGHERDQIQGIVDAVDELQSEGLGDILVFLNGEREIRDTADALNKLKLRDTEVLPLYARLTNAEQNRIFQSHVGRRVVLSTNVAETSLTVPGIKYVIDPGTARISRYSFRTKVQRLPIEAISQASANQRMGRCGRVSAGICIRLYSEEDFNNRPEFTDPEIQRTNLASVILKMHALGLGDVANFPFVQPPDSRNITDGLKLLEELGAIDISNADHNKRLTPVGIALAKLPIDPRLARMVMEANTNGCLNEVMVITAALSIQDPRERPIEKQQAADEQHRRFYDKESDFITFLNLWNYVKQQQDALSSSQFRRLCKKDYLAYMRVREWQDIYSQLSQVVKELGFNVNPVQVNEEGEVSNSDNIHKALLAGMLSHIGFKDKDQDYLGARNSKFNIFPGSGLFKKQPKWVMVAELVETSRLFGRIAAKIQPEWIEPLAPHLNKSTYSEPHWEKRRGAVVAAEKVTLYGLVIVAKRMVNYSQIDPGLCREIFIRSGLVEGEFNTKHAFFKHNMAEVERIHALEHKSRRRDILVSDDDLFGFYADIIPDYVCSGRHFDSWWKKESKQTPDLLTLTQARLMKHNAEAITAHSYPEFWSQNSFKFKLEYNFEPGTVEDGITVIIPLSILNQVNEQGFDWQIPALREELIITMIKALPKTLRRNFVPAPNYAGAALENMDPSQGELAASLNKQLLRMTGVRLELDVWEHLTLPTHLKMHFKVVDEKLNKISIGDDLGVLKQQLQGNIQETLVKVADKGIEKKDLITWDFGHLPTEFKQKHGGYEVKAYPALVDNKKSVEIKLFDHQEDADVAAKAGLRRLILLNVPSPIKYLEQKLPNKAKLGLYFNPFGKVTDLIHDCISCAVDNIIEKEPAPSDADSFEVLKERVRANIADETVEVAKQVEKILTAAHQVHKQIKGKVSLDMIVANGDIKAQLAKLIYSGFVTNTGVKKLADVQRYIAAIEHRLNKLKIDPIRDRGHSVEVQPLLEIYVQLTKMPRLTLAQQSELLKLRWMLEELRVSLFAQQLGTSYPVSIKRVKIAFAEFKASL